MMALMPMMKTLWRRRRWLLCLPVVLLMSCGDTGADAGAKQAEPVLEETHLADEVTQLPDFVAIKDVRERKQRFFGFLRPIIEVENARVRRERESMLAVNLRLDRGEKLTEEERTWLFKLAMNYNVSMQDESDEQAWKLLKRRVDTVPFRLALAQAANESNWGRSRFAREGLNLFGQWCFTPGCGLVPKHRETGLTHEVAVYPSVNASVAAYIRSINRVQMYTPLRTLRRQIRRSGEKPTAIELAGGLKGYSERGQDYVDEIRAMIRANYKLMGAAPAVSLPPSALTAEVQLTH